MNALAEKLMRGIRRNKTKVVELVDFSQELADHVDEYEVLTPNQRKDIMSKEAHIRTSPFLDYLPKRPPKKQVLFAKALIKTGQDHILTDYLGFVSADIQAILAIEPHSDSVDSFAGSSSGSSQAQSAPPAANNSSISVGNVGGSIGQLGNNNIQGGRAPVFVIHGNYSVSNTGNMMQGISGQSVTQAAPEAANRAPAKPAVKSGGGDDSADEGIDLDDDWNGEELLEIEHCSEDFYLRKSNQEIYQMKRKPRGKALIINVYKVKTHKYPRDGTHVDCKALKNLFEKLHFEVQIKEDKDILKAKSITRKVEEFFEDEHHEDSSAAVLVLLSHGGTDENGKEFILGNDGEKVFLKDLYFIMEECKSLVGKPKIVLVQACRAAAGKGGDDYGQDAADDGDDEDDDAKEDDRLAKGSDTIMAYATQPGRKAMRNTKDGSWFVQAIVKVFCQYAAEMDLVRLFTKVKLSVSRKVSDKGKKSMPVIHDSFCKELYFFPGMPK